MGPMIRFVSYNLLDYGYEQDERDAERWERVHQVIRDLVLAAREAGDGLVLAVQELVAAGEGDAQTAAAARRLCQLGEATGLDCHHAPGQAAVAVGNHRFHCGLLWSDGITPAGGWTAHAGTAVWHSLASLRLDVGAARPVRHASYHAGPFGRRRRADEAERVLATMTRPACPGLIGGDWNSISADRVQRDDRWPYYDPDPYAGLGRQWHGDLVYQAVWGYDDRGHRWWRADRDPGEALYSGGLRDAAPALDAPWQATVGHWPIGDPYGPRRIDAIRATPDVVPALRHHEVTTTGFTLTTSDHLPVTVIYDPAAISDGFQDS